MSEKKEEKIRCGLIMPISAIGNYKKEHWEEVKKIIEEAIENMEENIEVRMVSDRSEHDLIQSNIVQAIYDDNIVICDVSGKNPNVMFELGMRIAFNKPVIIIYDEKDGYPFDITNIKYLKYPEGLNYHAIKEFKKDLQEKIKTALNEKENAFLKTFTREFKTYQVTSEKVEINEVDKVILDRLDVLTNKIELIERQNSLESTLRNISPNLINNLRKRIENEKIHQLKVGKIISNMNMEEEEE